MSQIMIEPNKKYNTTFYMLSALTIIMDFFLFLVFTILIL